MKIFIMWAGTMNALNFGGVSVKGLTWENGMRFNAATSYYFAITLMTTLVFLKATGLVGYARKIEKNQHH